MAARAEAQRRGPRSSTGAGRPSPAGPDALGYIRRGDGPAVMTLRVLALVLAVALAVPAAVALARAALAGRDRDAAPARRRLDALWVVVPIAMLAAFLVLAATA
jgi:heme/copper-type cytochrome/quinol oxidase subunit 2